MAVIILRSAPESVSGVRFTADSTRVACDPPSTYANSTGVITVGEQRLVFYSAERQQGFALDYQDIVIHAVARGDPSDSSGEADEAHLYCQIDGPFPGCGSSANGQNQSENNDDDNDGASDDEAFAELKFYLADKSQLDELFQAMCDCAALNPDAEDEDEENCASDVGEDGGTADIQTIENFDPNAFITNEDQLDQLTPEGRAVLAHLESVIVASGTDANGGRFDDADEADCAN